MSTAPHVLVREALAGIDSTALIAGLAGHLQRIGAGVMKDPGNAERAGAGAVALIAALLGEGGPAAAQTGARASFSPRFSPADWAAVGAALLLAVDDLSDDGMDAGAREAWGLVWGEAVAAAGAASARAAAAGSA
ncbi:MAG: hypothetical protein L6R48_23995 [Planctomycetes bacterium]|nr:hypothetical protein [Planctomycetota bacterium]